MNMPKEITHFCKVCRKHTKHTVHPAKKKTPSSAHPMSHGSKYRMAERGKSTGTGNKGRMSKGALSGWKMYGKKATKKTDLRFTCKTCKKTSTQRKGFRLKKLELL